MPGTASSVRVPLAQQSARRAHRRLRLDGSATVSATAEGLCPLVEPASCWISRGCGFGLQLSILLDDEPWLCPSANLDRFGAALLDAKLWTQLRLLPSLAIYPTDSQCQLRLELQSTDTLPPPPCGVRCASLDGVDLQLSFSFDSESPRPRKRPKTASGRRVSRPSHRTSSALRLGSPGPVGTASNSLLTADDMIDLFDPCFRDLIRSDLCHLCPLVFMPDYAQCFVQQYGLVSTLTDVFSTSLYNRCSSAMLKTNLEKLSRLHLLDLAVTDPGIGIAAALEYSIRRQFFETVRSSLAVMDTSGRLAHIVSVVNADSIDDVEDEFLMLPHASSDEDSDFNALDDVSEDDYLDPLTPPCSQSSPILQSSSPMMHLASSPYVHPFDQYMQLPPSPEHSYNQLSDSSDNNSMIIVDIV